MRVPDALPMLEPIRADGPNKPYAVLGESYTPLAADAPLSESGLASWYGRKFHGRRTASGEVYDMYAMTAAHRTLPLPSYVRVSNPANGRSVIVRVNDRGPFTKDRIIDLSYTAAQKLGVFGVARVEIVRITPDEIRRGTWQATPQAIERRLLEAASP
jgi:rare lipoprotein A